MGRHSRKRTKSINEDGDDKKSDVSDEEPKVKNQKRASESDISDETLEDKINRIVEKKTAVYKEEIDLLKANQYRCPWEGNCPCCQFWNKGKLKKDIGGGMASSSGGPFRSRGGGGWRGTRGNWRGSSGQWRGNNSNWRSGYFS